MSTPGRGKECIIAMYDSYAKTVMRNQCRNAIKSKRRRQRRETPGTESMQYLFEMQPHTDIYPSEHLVIFEDTYICVITSEKLYGAARHQDVCKRHGTQSFLLQDLLWRVWKDLHEPFMEKPGNPTMAVQGASDERGADLPECFCGSRRSQERFCDGLQ